ncbi:MAG TPA: YtxH domain-containing protein [Desulfuromonadaceae bacterium]
MAHKINTTMKGALTFAGGGILGAGVALLLAPRSGRKTRKGLIRFASTVGSKTERTANELVSTLTDLAATVEKKTSGLLRGGREMSREARKGLLKAMDRGQDRLDRQRHRLARMIG